MFFDCSDILSKSFERGEEAGEQCFKPILGINEFLSG